MFATLHNDILKIYKRHKERDAELLLPYSQILKFILLRKQGTVSFPNDNDVKSAFPTRQIYRIPSNYKFFLFERMENENSPEANDTIVKKNEGRHIHHRTHHASDTNTSVERRTGRKTGSRYMTPISTLLPT